MPGHLKDKYQYYTCAEMEKLQSAGCMYVCRSLEEAVREYICDYLDKDAYLDPSVE
jgi:ADP-L-glycero-D-manno-heptose 6-epimerase